MFVRAIIPLPAPDLPSNLPPPPPKKKTPHQHYPGGRGALLPQRPGVRLPPRAPREAAQGQGAPQGAEAVRLFFGVSGAFLMLLRVRGMVGWLVYR